MYILGLLVFPLYLQYLYYDIAENTESIKKQVKILNCLQLLKLSEML